MNVRVKTAADLLKVIERVKETPGMIRAEANYIEDLLVKEASRDTGKLKTALLESGVDNTDGPNPFFGIGNYGPGTALGDPFHPLGGTISDFLKQYRKSVEYKEARRQYMRDYRARNKATK